MSEAEAEWERQNVLAAEQAEEISTALMWETVQAMYEDRRPRGNVDDIIADYRKACDE